MRGPDRTEIYQSQITNLEAKLANGTGIASGAKRMRLELELAILKYHAFGVKIPASTVRGSGRLLPDNMVNDPYREFRKQDKKIYELEQRRSYWIRSHPEVYPPPSLSDFEDSL